MRDLPPLTLTLNHALCTVGSLPGSKADNYVTNIQQTGYFMFTLCGVLYSTGSARGSIADYYVVNIQRTGCSVLTVYCVLCTTRSVRSSMTANCGCCRKANWFIRGVPLTL